MAVLAASSSQRFSASRAVCGRKSGLGATWFISQKRAAFHNLVTKLRPSATRAGPSLMSRPGPVSVQTAKRRASAPYSSIMASGSMTLPFDLDIFWPRSSRTRPWMHTVRNGTSPMKCRPIIIIRATQKKMMSNPVTSTSVG